MALRTIRRPFSDPRVRASLRRILEDSPLCSMATVTPRRRAHINTAYVAYAPSLELYFLSDAKSQHCQNLATNPSLAMTIFDSRRTWGGSDRGVQLFGNAAEARGNAAAKAEATYAARFPVYGKWMRSRSAEERALAADLRALRFYRFRPTRLKILDEPEFGGGVFVTAEIPKRARLER